MIEIYVQFDYTLYDKSISDDGITWRIPRMLLVYIFHKPIIVEIRIVFLEEREKWKKRVFPFVPCNFFPFEATKSL